jgi:hypothetical protein
MKYKCRLSVAGYPVCKPELEPVKNFKEILFVSRSWNQ